MANSRILDPFSRPIAPAAPLAGAAQVLRGVQRMLRAQNFESVAEMPLGNGRRADVLAVGPAGDIWIIEIKSCAQDFRADGKWPEYLDYCDYFSFAVAPQFPTEILPADAGLVLADDWGGEIERAAARQPLPAARRKAVMLSFARLAAMRLHAHTDPSAGIG